MLKNKLHMYKLIAALLLCIAPMTVLASTVVDQNFLQNSTIKVNYAKKEDVKTIVRITKDNKDYDYDLVHGAEYPLNLGNGQYTVMIVEGVGGNKYKVVAKEEVMLILTNDKKVFLQSIALIDWNNKTKAVIKAKELVKNCKTEKEKVAVIYSYIIKNFSYDYDRAKTVQAGYIPNLDDVYNASEGICYDYAATFAAMLRSVGIPTKLVMGYQKDNLKTYHAWNQVFLEDSNEWVTIDTTYDAARIQGELAVKMIQNAEDYKISKIY